MTHGASERNRLGSKRCSLQQVGDHGRLQGSGDLAVPGAVNGSKNTSLRNVR